MTSVSVVLQKGRVKPPTLKQYFEDRYGMDAGTLERAKTNFARSLAGYAVVCYIMQVRCIADSTDPPAAK